MANRDNDSRKLCRRSGQFGSAFLTKSGSSTNKKRRRLCGRDNIRDLSRLKYLPLFRHWYMNNWVGEENMFLFTYSSEKYNACYTMFKTKCVGRGLVPSNRNRKWSEQNTAAQ